jgi:ATP-binding cassette subfamily B protein
MAEIQEQDFSAKFSWGTWKKIFFYLAPLKKTFIIGMIAVSIIAVVDVLFPLMTKWVIDDHIAKGNLKGLWLFGGLFTALALVQALAIFIHIRNAGKIEVQLAYHLRKAAFEHLQELSFSYFNKTPVGWIMARVTSDANRLSEIISWGFIDLSWGLIMMTGITIVMFILNVKLALITLAVLPVLILVTVFIRKIILKIYREVRKINSKITGSFNEGITGAKTSKTLVLEEKNSFDFEKLANSMRVKSIRAAVISSLFLPAVLIIGFVGTALAIYYGGDAYAKNIIEFGTLFLFITFSTQFFEPVMQLARILAELQQAQASAERLISLLETTPEIVDREDVKEIYGDFLNFKQENWEELIGQVSFEHVDFAYKDGETILNDFNLEVAAGETIALVGETGAGKSTIVNLICRFFEPTGGRILIDGKDYMDRSLGWLHANLGYVLQSPHLFSGTIMDNIRYGRLNASDEEVIEAATLVDAHDFILSFEAGYNTDVGEGGGRLSTGQKQLISFARAILADPRILILDEATSSIDTETEKKVQHAIVKLLEGRTNFIVAHRLSTIINSDKILVIKDGKITESGSHDELIELKGYYYRLYTNQFVLEQTQQLGF